LDALDGPPNESPNASGSAAAAAAGADGAELDVVGLAPNALSKPEPEPKSSSKPDETGGAATATAGIVLEGEVLARVTDDTGEAAGEALIGAVALGAALTAAAIYNTNAQSRTTKDSHGQMIFSKANFSTPLRAAAVSDFPGPCSLS
jgi:hypothetical protein